MYEDLWILGAKASQPFHTPRVKRFGKPLRIPVERARLKHNLSQVLKQILRRFDKPDVTLANFS